MGLLHKLASKILQHKIKGYITEVKRLENRLTELTDKYESTRTELRQLQKKVNSSPSLVYRIPRSEFDKMKLGLPDRHVSTSTTDLQVAAWAGMQLVLDRLEREYVNERE